MDHSQAFNGQHGRREMVKEIFDNITFDTVIETGTFKGNTSAYLASLSEDTPVFTCDSEDVFDVAAPKIMQYDNIIFRHASSMRLFELMPRIENTFIYLDSHWCYLTSKIATPCPLKAELEYLDKNASNCVIMIDDFKVDDDIGYRYDTYDGVSLSSENYMKYIRGKLYAPSMKSEDEAAPKTGCIVIAQPGVDLRNVKSLRYVGEGGPEHWTTCTT